MTDRYESIDVVGAGGMATVWRARDRELGRMVAIKRPHPAPADSLIHERFRREARAAAAVSHPNLVTVYDAAVDDEGPYLVMELVDAPSLADSVVEPGDAVKIGAALASALAALHAVDIVHRDVKPSNILLAAGGPQLTDFGIARSLDATDDVTQAGVHLGTPSYAPPETLAGGAHDAASDVYSLAVVIHEMFTGERFASPSGTQVMVTDRLLSPVLERALRADPRQRPTAAEFARDLEASQAAPGADSTQAFGPDHVDAGVVDPTSPEPRLDMIGASVDSTVMADLRERWASADTNSRWLVLALGGCASLAVVLLVVGVTRDTGDSDAALQTAPVAGQQVDAQQSVAVDAPAPDEVDGQDSAAVDQQVPAPVADPVLDAIAAARTAFDGYVSGLPDDVLEDKERERVFEDTSGAIDDAARGDQDGSRRGFEAVVKRLDGKVSDDAARDQSIALLVALADSLGVTIDN